MRNTEPTETVEDVVKWLNHGLKAVNLNAEVQRFNGVQPYEIKTETPPNFEDHNVQIGGFTIMPRQIELDGIKKGSVWGWGLDTTVLVRGAPQRLGDPGDPDTSDLVEIGTYRTAFHVARECIVLLVKDRLDAYLQSKGEAEEHEKQKAEAPF